MARDTRDPEKRQEWKVRKSLEIRAMIREASENMKAAGVHLDVYDRVPPEQVAARRIWDSFSDRRTLTGRLLGDPIPERSAWWEKRMEAAE
jgi:hypothetical protein